LSDITTDVVIIGAGPCGLFQVFELGLLGISAHIIDSLPIPGGQCAELYPEKPIYDIPALPVCGAQELVDRLMKQIEPFKPQFHLGEEVLEFARREDGRFKVGTTAGTVFNAGAVVIAAGVGSFQPRRIGVEGADLFEGTAIHYRVKNSTHFHGKRLVVFGGGDSALDWVLELAPKAHSVTLVHRRSEFRAAPASVAKMRDLVKEGRMQHYEGLPHSLIAEGSLLQGVNIKLKDGGSLELDAYYVLVFFGLNP
jgi:thioredoxin reductase (NADPH)